MTLILLHIATHVQGTTIRERESEYPILSWQIGKVLNFIKIHLISTPTWRARHQPGWRQATKPSALTSPSASSWPTRAQSSLAKRSWPLNYLTCSKRKPSSRLQRGSACEDTFSPIAAQDHWRLKCKRFVRLCFRPPSFPWEVGAQSSLVTNLAPNLSPNLSANSVTNSVITKLGNIYCDKFGDKISEHPFWW